MKEIFVELNESAFRNGNLSLSDILDESRFVYDRPENIVLIAMYIPVFFFAVVFNILVIGVFIKYRSFRTVTNCLLMNLSIADLLVTLICMPAAILQGVYAVWAYGDFFCKVAYYLQGVSVSSSVFTLTAMSVDRYLAIRHPLKRKNFISKKLTMKVIAILWTVSLLIFAPTLYVRQTDGYRLMSYDFGVIQDTLYCVEIWPDTGGISYQKMFGLIVFTSVFAIPVLIIAIAYSLMGCTLCQRQLLPDFPTSSNGSNNQPHSVILHSAQIYSMSTINMMKERRKVAKTLLILAFVFACCWLPSSCLFLYLDLRDPVESHEINPHEDEYLYEKLQQYFILLGHFNSLLNPVLYCLMTRNFRNHVMDCFRKPTRREPISMNLMTV